MKKPILSSCLGLRPTGKVRRFALQGFLALLSAVVCCGCQIVGASFVDGASQQSPEEAARNAAHNSFVQSAYGDMVTELSHYFALGYNQFAVLGATTTEDAAVPQSQTPSRSSASRSQASDTAASAGGENPAPAPYVRAITEEQALGRALQQHGAEVCYSRPNCKFDAIELSTSQTTAPSYVLLELFAPELTLQRLYAKGSSAKPLGPVSVYGERPRLHASELTASKAQSLLAAADIVPASTKSVATQKATTSQKAPRAKKATAPAPEPSYSATIKIPWGSENSPAPAPATRSTPATSPAASATSVAAAQVSSKAQTPAASVAPTKAKGPAEAAKSAATSVESKESSSASVQPATKDGSSQTPQAKGEAADKQKALPLRGPLQFANEPTSEPTTLSALEPQGQSEVRDERKAASEDSAPHELLQLLEKEAQTAGSTQSTLSSNRPLSVLRAQTKTADADAESSTPTPLGPLESTQGDAASLGSGNDALLSLIEHNLRERYAFAPISEVTVSLPVAEASRYTLRPQRGQAVAMPFVGVAEGTAATESTESYGLSPLLQLMALRNSQSSR